MTHRDGFPRFSARSAWRGDAGHREPCGTPPESLGKPPFRSRGRTAGGRRKALTMPRIACGFSPARWIAHAISMGHYQHSLVWGTAGGHEAAGELPAIRATRLPGCRSRRPASSNSSSAMCTIAGDTWHSRITSSTATGVGPSDSSIRPRASAISAASGGVGPGPGNPRLSAPPQGV